MKHSLEEKIVLKTGNINLLFFLFFLFLPKLSAQISVNGFINYNSTKLNDKFTYFYSIDFNYDGYSDLLLFNNSKNYTILKGSPNGFLKPIKKRIPYNITFISSYYINNAKTFIFALARNDRMAAQINISSEGNISFGQKTFFKSYPSFAEIGDVSGDGNPDVLVCGENFNGVSLLKVNNNGRIYENKIITDFIFKNAHFADLDYDGFQDLVCFNNITNNLDLFYNTLDGLFRKERSLSLLENIYNINLLDFNNDKFTDILVSKENGFEVLYGDSVSSFSNQIGKSFQYSPSKIAINDFNQNGLKDFAFFDHHKGSLVILFSNYTDTLGTPIEYLKDWYINQIYASNDKNGANLFILSHSNEIITINKLSNITDNTKILLGGKIGAFGKFNYGRLLNSGLYFVNSNDLTFNILLKQKKTFDIYYKVAIEEIPNKVKVFFSNKNYYFVLNNANTSFCEVIIYNFQKNIYKLNKIFTSAPIHDFSINRNDEGLTLTILTKSKGKLEYLKYLEEDGEFSIDDYEEITTKVYDAKINYNNPRYVYLWRLNDLRNNFIFSLYDFNEDSQKEISTLQIENYKDVNFNSFLSNYSNKQKIYTSFIYADSSYYYLTYMLNSPTAYLEKITDKNNLFQNNFSITNRLVSFGNFLFINNSKNNYLVKLGFNKNKIVFEDKFIFPYTTDYFLSNYENKTFVVFADEFRNFINFKKIGD